MLWMYVNRNNFPIFLPDPKDPGSRVAFGPCPDKTKPLGMMDVKTNPFYANFVGYKRSISQEPIPAYMKMTEQDIDGRGDTSIHDLMKMSPQKVAEYIKFLAQSNPDVADQITRSLATDLPMRSDPTHPGA